jgi:hypothetical protein
MCALSDPDRVLVAGDTHANSRWVESLVAFASDLECDFVVQLGDFGYWPHTPEGRSFLDHCESTARHAGIPVLWIDGNHENHSRLRELSARADGIVEISPNVLHAPRGVRWTWSGVRFGALGGAFSIDWRTRKVGTSWWPDEDLTHDDVERLGDAPLDVLLTHDAPAEVPLVGVPLRFDDEARAKETKRLISSAIVRTNPRVVLHGHWHHRYSHRIARRDDAMWRESAELRWLWTQVHGLASDIEGNGGSWGVLDLPTLEFVDGTALADGLRGTNQPT